MKKLLESIVKKTKKRHKVNEMNVEQISSTSGNVDFFEYKNHILYVEGWIFDTKYKMYQNWITFYENNKKVKEIEPSVVYRKDVSQVLQNPEAEKTGFFVEAYVETRESLEVFFEYYTENGIKRFYIGNIEGSSEENKITIFSKRRIENIGNIRYLQEDVINYGGSKERKELYYEFRKIIEERNKNVVLAFDHFLGGGATSYLDEKCANALDEGKTFVIIRQDTKGPTYYLQVFYGKIQLEVYERDLQYLLNQLDRVNEIWINELVTYINPYDVMKSILKLKQKTNAKMIMLLHDYYSICPAVNLINDQGRYCSAPNEEICNKCIPNNRSNACLEYESGTRWRKEWLDFLSMCEDIVAFSEDTQRLIRKVYPALDNIKVVPHTPHILPLVQKEEKTTQSFNIGLLGILCYKKGSEVVKELIEFIEQKNLNIKIKLIGVSDEKFQSMVFSNTGKYTLSNLPELTIKEDIDIFLLPSICPETFSYTTAEVISMGMPIAVFPIGAPQDKVRAYEKGLILEDKNPEYIIFEMWNFMKKIQPEMVQMIELQERN